MDAGRHFDKLSVSGGGANSGVLKRDGWEASVGGRTGEGWTGVHCLPPMCPVSA